MTTEDELQRASQRYADDLVERYGTGDERIPPRDLDAILDKVAAKGGDVTMLEKQLSGYVTTRAVKRAEGTVDYSELTDKMEQMITKGLADSGWDTPPVDHEVPPDPEPQPFGQRQPNEGDTFESIQTRYGNGEIDEETYTREREARGMPPMRA